MNKGAFMTADRMSEPGPCIICGDRDYPLSAGGPTICPSCDCGDFGLAKVKRQAAEIERLTAREAAADAEFKRLNTDIVKRARKAIEAADEIERLDDRVSDLTEALHKIDSWSRAYPLDVFPTPDLDKAARVLRENGMTIDSISAHVARHVVEGVGKIARDVLKIE